MEVAWQLGQSFWKLNCKIWSQMFKTEACTVSDSNLTDTVADSQVDESGVQSVIWRISNAQENRFQHFNDPLWSVFWFN